MKIEIYQRTETGFERVATTYKAEDVDFTETLYDEGEFSIQIPMGAKYTELLQSDAILHIGDFWGVILYTKRTASESSTLLNVSGIDLKTYILKKRCVIPTDYTSQSGSAGYDIAEGSTEEVIKHFWENNITAPANTARKIDFITIAANQGRGLAEDKYMARFEQLDVITKELCENVKIGYKAYIENGNIILDVYEGIDRTAEQTENARAIFEISRKNVASLEHEVDKREYKNTFYTVQAGAEFADEALTMTYFRNDEVKSGWERDEKQIEVSAETPEAGQEYEELKYQAEKTMGSYDIKESFVCEITNSRYKELWNIGDFVTVRWPEQGITLNTQVTAVTTIANGSELLHVAKFGSSKPKYVGIKEKIIRI